MLEYEKAFLILIQALDYRHPAIMNRIFELLGAVSLPEAGKAELVLNAFTEALPENSHRRRFWILIEGLKWYRKGEWPVAISSIQLINCLINHPIDDLEQRLYLRSELYQTTDESGDTDFRQIVSEVDKELSEKWDKEDWEQTENSAAIAPALSNPRKFFNFFNMFLNYKDDDFDEMASRFENIRFDFDNAEDTFTVLKNSVQNTSVESNFLNILHLLMFIRDDPYTK